MFATNDHYTCLIVNLQKGWYKKNMSYYFDSKNGNHIIEVNNLGQYLNKNNLYFAIIRKKFDLYF